MAQEINVIYEAAKTVYFTVQNSDFKFYNGTSFVDKQDVNWSTYARPLTASLVDSSIYVGNFPVIAAGQYIVRVWEQVDTSRLPTDPFLVAGVMNWDGTHETGGFPIGNGIKILTITAKDFDSAQPLEDVRVRISKGDAFFEWTTNAQGTAVFAVTAGTWTITYYKFGYLGGSTGVTVNTDIVFPVTLKQQFITPAPALEKCRCWQIARTAQGEINPGAKFEFNLIRAPTTEDDSYSTRNFIIEAGVDGMASVDLPRTAVYEYRYGRRNVFKRFTVPNAPTYKMPEVDSGD